MDFEEEDNFYDNDFNEILNRFEKYLNGEPLGFIDSDSLESLIDHFLIQGNYSKAATCADIGMEQFPFISLFCLRKAQAISAAGQLKEALNLLRQIEQFDQLSCEFYLTKAAIFSQLRDTKTAIKYFQEALAISEPEDKDEIFIDLAVEYENCKDYVNAIKILNEALTYNPSNEVAIYELAFCYDQIEEFDKAIECYSNFIDENPYSFTAWYNLGNAYSKLENHEKSIMAFEYCVLINEDFSPAYFNLGNAYLSLDKYLKAIECFEKCIEIDGDDGMCYCYIGEAQEQIGQLELAKNSYAKSLELIPDLSDAWLGLGIVKDLEGDTKSAIPLLLKAIELEPSNASYYHVLAGAYEKNLDFENAQENYLLAIEKDLTNSEIIVDYVNFLVQFDLIKEAFVFLKSYISDNSDVLNTIRLVLVNLNFFYGDRNLSLSMLQDLIEDDFPKAKELFSLYPDLLNETKIVNLFPNSLL